MPNVGRPSRGCKECKARKVKCDERFPACHRCLRNGRGCSGTLSASDVAFRNSVPGLVTRDSPQTSQDKSTSSSRQYLLTASIPTPMSSDWQNQAISMFFHDYVIGRHESQIDFGHFDILPNMLGKASGTSALSYAVSAVALTSFAHRSRMDALIFQAREAYGKALQSIISLIGKHPDPNDPNVSSDFMLATILVLNCYEVVSGEKPPGGLWSSHTNILETLLCVRHNQQGQSQASRNLTYSAHSVLMIRKVSDKEEMHKNAVLPIHENQDLTLVQMRELLYAVCHALKEIHTMIQKDFLDDDSVASLSRLTQSSMLLNKKLQTWEHQSSEVYSYHCVLYAHIWPPGKSLAVGAPTSIHVYSSLSIASMWNLHRTTRIYLLRCLIRGLSRLALERGQITDLTANEGREAQMKRQMQRLADDICGSVPYMLGDVDQEERLQHNRHNKAVGGFFLLWPLGSLLGLGILSPERIAWIRERLNYIRDGLGIQHWVNTIPAVTT